MPEFRVSAQWRAIVLATTLAGTLHLLGSFALAVIASGSPLGVLRGIGGAVVMPGDLAGFENVQRGLTEDYLLAAAGLALHFGIMLVIAMIYVAAAARVRLVNRLALLSGIGFGIMVWLVMHWLVLPWRWPTMFPVGDTTEMAIMLAMHVFAVGIPIALVTRAAARWG